MVKKKIVDTNSKEERKEMIEKIGKISVRKQCELIEVNRSSLYYTPLGESQENLTLMKLLDAHHVEYPFKGVLQMQDYLSMQGYTVNHKRVRRLMRLMGIEALYPKKNLSKLGKAQYIKPYLLKDLTINRPNQVWSIDISYIPMERGFMYLTAVIDWYSRRVLGFALSNSLEAYIQTDLIEELVEIFGKPEIINSDQGSQYTSEIWEKCLTNLDIKISMDGKGRATDNIIVERFFRTMKQEYIYLHPESCGKQLYKGIEKFINYYNNARTHQGIQRQIPIEVYNGTVNLDKIIQLKNA